jgi:predicted nuclease of predicted toxin-antitoxin system
LKFKIDENLPDECVSLLREAGFEADSVQDENLAGSDDLTLFDRCQIEERILVTLDLDFSSVKLFPPGTHQGIVIIRSKHQDKTTLLALIRRMVLVMGVRSPQQQLWIVEADRIRFREK